MNQTVWFDVCMIHSFFYLVTLNHMKQK
jgi:hypothetical protein